ncbi:MAG: HAD family phosphatase [Acidobacteria bacterium]|nr:MAG: HAD family phosphatase [Acidobacteriota bacterium]REK04582.1 MAG: HAD family phosphatase [Acidobacteriota bacterium]
MGIRAVIFDLGGVVLGSPLHAIARLEEEHGLERDVVNRHVVASAPDGAWHRMERGEVAVGDAFFAEFDRELAGAGAPISSAVLFERIAAEAQPRPIMLRAIDRLREAGFKVAALTNNWSDERPGSDSSFKRGDLHARFELVVESSVVGLRKPDPRIYRLTCERLGVEPAEAAFLDDIGSNLKSARALGLTTIKVVTPEQALEELEDVVGLALR